MLCQRHSQQYMYKLQNLLLSWSVLPVDQFATHDSGNLPGRWAHHLSPRSQWVWVRPRHDMVEALHVLVPQWTLSVVPQWWEVLGGKWRGGLAQGHVNPLRAEWFKRNINLDCHFCIENKNMPYSNNIHHAYEWPGPVSYLWHSKSLSQWEMVLYM